MFGQMNTPLVTEPRELYTAQLIKHVVAREITYKWGLFWVFDNDFAQQINVFVIIFGGYLDRYLSLFIINYRYHQYSSPMSDSSYHVVGLILRIFLSAVQLFNMNPYSQLDLVQLVPVLNYSTTHCSLLNAHSLFNCCEDSVANTSSEEKVFVNHVGIIFFSS